MLHKLFIQNYAIIDELEITFFSGMNVITGETGAGKSILVGALNLILGQRADNSVLKDGNKKCIVEGVFKIEENEQVMSFFEDEQLEYDTEVVIRRELSLNGKSRSFINDTLVSVSQIKKLSIFLVDLHQQFDTLDITTTNFQKEMLDAFADNLKDLQKMRTAFKQYTQIKLELEQLKAIQEQANKELDYHQFLFNELSELDLKENELENLEEELRLLSNAENVKNQLSATIHELKNADQPIVNQLKSIQLKLNTIAPFHKEIETLEQRLLAVNIELKDIANDLEKLEYDIHADSAKMEMINERLSAGYKLLKKHNLLTTNDLLMLQMELEKKLESVTDLFSNIEKISKELEINKAICLEIANIISQKRKTSAKSFIDAVNQLLIQVGMPNARIKIDITPAELQINGIDEIQFLFDANNSKKFEPLGKVASGGELSRLMLSIKSLVAKKLQLPTLIFDEIDTGISGEAANQVGLIMKGLSHQHQLITITHQAQIAAKANAHFFVHKEKSDRGIKTGIKLLEGNDRIEAIAKILSGDRLTAAALANAKELLNN